MLYSDFPNVLPPFNPLNVKFIFKLSNTIQSHIHNRE
jgi:hypothetical protein